MKRVKIVTALLCLAVILLLISQCSNVLEFAGKKITKYYENERAYPKSGEYYCAELDCTLAFSEKGNTIRYSNGETDIIYPTYGGNFDSESNDLFAFYHWNQKKDQITLKIRKFRDHFEEGKRYLFIKLN